MSTRQKLRHLLRVLYQSKGFIACFSIVLSLLLVVGSTYAWLTDSDQRINRAAENTGKLSAILVEDFERVYHWAPGTTKEKKVRVKNVGEMPAIVRVSFTEAFLGFDVDKTDNHRENSTLVNGNGNLKLHEFDSQTDTLVDEKDLTTWEIGHVYEFDSGKYYIANAKEPEQPYQYKGTRADLLAAFQLNFQTAKVFDTPADTVGQTDYWYYEDGYFYYSEVLQAEDDPTTPQTENLTTDLLESIRLDAHYGNQYKGALYKLIPQMDAHDIGETLINDWSIQTSSHVYDMYQGKLAK